MFLAILSVCLFVLNFTFVCLHVYVYVCVPVCVAVWVPVCLSVCLLGNSSVCLFTVCFCSQESVLSSIQYETDVAFSEPWGKVVVGGYLVVWASMQEEGRRGRRRSTRRCGVSGGLPSPILLKWNKT